MNTTEEELKKKGPDVSKENVEASSVSPATPETAPGYIEEIKNDIAMTDEEKAKKWAAHEDYKDGAALFEKNAQLDKRQKKLNKNHMLVAIDEADSKFESFTKLSSNMSYMALSQTVDAFSKKVNAEWISNFKNSVTDMGMQAFTGGHLDLEEIEANESYQKASAVAFDHIANNRSFYAATLWALDIVDDASDSVKRDEVDETSSEYYGYQRQKTIKAVNNDESLTKAEKKAQLKKLDDDLWKDIEENGKSHDKAYRARVEKWSPEQKAKFMTRFWRLHQNNTSAKIWDTVGQGQLHEDMSQKVKDAMAFSQNAYELSSFTAKGYGLAVLQAVIDPLNLVGAGVAGKVVSTSAKVATKLPVTRTLLKWASKSSWGQKLFGKAFAVSVTDGVMMGTSDAVADGTFKGQISSGKFSWKQAIVSGVAAVPFALLGMKKSPAKDAVSKAAADAAQDGAEDAAKKATAKFKFPDVKKTLQSFPNNLKSFKAANKKILKNAYNGFNKFRSAIGLGPKHHDAPPKPPEMTVVYKKNAPDLPIGIINEKYLKVEDPNLKAASVAGDWINKSAKYVADEISYRSGNIKRNIGKKINRIVDVPKTAWHKIEHTARAAWASPKTFVTSIGNGLIAKPKRLARATWKGLNAELDGRTVGKDLLSLLNPIYMLRNAVGMAGITSVKTIKFNALGRLAVHFGNDLYDQRWGRRAIRTYQYIFKGRLRAVEGANEIFKLDLTSHKYIKPVIDKTDDVILKQLTKIYGKAGDPKKLNYALRDLSDSSASTLSKARAILEIKKVAKLGSLEDIKKLDDAMNILDGTTPTGSLKQAKKEIKKITKAADTTRVDAALEKLADTTGSVSAAEKAQARADLKDLARVDEIKDLDDAFKLLEKNGDADAIDAQSTLESTLSAEDLTKTNDAFSAIADDTADAATRRKATSYLFKIRAKYSTPAFDAAMQMLYDNAVASEAVNKTIRKMSKSGDIENIVKLKDALAVLNDDKARPAAKAQAEIDAKEAAQAIEDNGLAGKVAELSDALKPIKEEVSAISLLPKQLKEKTKKLQNELNKLVMFSGDEYKVNPKLLDDLIQSGKHDEIYDLTQRIVSKAKGLYDSSASAGIKEIKKGRKALRKADLITDPDKRILAILKAKGELEEGLKEIQKNINTNGTKSMRASRKNTLAKHVDIVEKQGTGLLKIVQDINSGKFDPTDPQQVGETFKRIDNHIRKSTNTEFVTDVKAARTQTALGTGFIEAAEMRKTGNNPFGHTAMYSDRVSLLREINESTVSEWARKEKIKRNVEKEGGNNSENYVIKLVEEPLAEIKSGKTVSNTNVEYAAKQAERITNLIQNGNDQDALAGIRMLLMHEGAGSVELISAQLKKLLEADLGKKAIDDPYFADYFDRISTLITDYRDHSPRAGGPRDAQKAFIQLYKKFVYGRMYPGEGQYLATPFMNEFVEKPVLRKQQQASAWLKAGKVVTFEEYNKLVEERNKVEGTFKSKKKPLPDDYEGKGTAEKELKTKIYTEGYWLLPKRTYANKDSGKWGYKNFLGYFNKGAPIAAKLAARWAWAAAQPTLHTSKLVFVKYGKTIGMFTGAMVGLHGLEYLYERGRGEDSKADVASRLYSGFLWTLDNTAMVPVRLTGHAANAITNTGLRVVGKEPVDFHVRHWHLQTEWLGGGYSETTGINYDAFGDRRDGEVFESFVDLDLQDTPEDLVKAVKDSSVDFVKSVATYSTLKKAADAGDKTAETQAEMQIEVVEDMQDNAKDALSDLQIAINDTREDIDGYKDSIKEKKATILAFAKAETIKNAQEKYDAAQEVYDSATGDAMRDKADEIVVDARIALADAKKKEKTNQFALNRAQKQKTEADARLTALEAELKTSVPSIVAILNNLPQKDAEKLLTNSPDIKTAVTGHKDLSRALEAFIMGTTYSPTPQTQREILLASVRDKIKAGTGDLTDAEKLAWKEVRDADPATLTTTEAAILKEIEVAYSVALLTSAKKKISNGEALNAEEEAALAAAKKNKKTLTPEQTALLTDITTLQDDAAKKEKEKEKEKTGPDLDEKPWYARDTDKTVSQDMLDMLESILPEGDNAGVSNAIHRGLRLTKAFGYQVKDAVSGTFRNLKSTSGGRTALGVGGGIASGWLGLMLYNKFFKDTWIGKFPIIGGAFKLLFVAATFFGGWKVTENLLQSDTNAKFVDKKKTEETKLSPEEEKIVMARNKVKKTLESLNETRDNLKKKITELYEKDDKDPEVARLQEVLKTMNENIESLMPRDGNQHVLNIVALYEQTKKQKGDVEAIKILTQDMTKEINALNEQIKAVEQKNKDIITAANIDITAVDTSGESKGDSSGGDSKSVDTKKKFKANTDELLKAGQEELVDNSDLDDENDDDLGNDDISYVGDMQSNEGGAKESVAIVNGQVVSLNTGHSNDELYFVSQGGQGFAPEKILLQHAGQDATSGVSGSVAHSAASNKSNLIFNIQDIAHDSDDQQDFAVRERTLTAAELEQINALNLENAYDNPAV